MTGLDIREARNGDEIQPGRVLVAPGDYHMRVALGVQARFVVTLDQGDKANGVRPAADFLFESAASAFGKSVLAFVLTGMGEDGRRGVKVVKEQGGRVVIQDRESSVVWGMPGAVFQDETYDLMLNIFECGYLALKKAAA